VEIMAETLEAEAGTTGAEMNEILEFHFPSILFILLGTEPLSVG